MFSLRIAPLLLAAASLVTADSTITPAPTPTAHLQERQSTPSPLTAYSYSYSDVPYKVNLYE
jgi:hypothetical protein